MHIDRPSTRLRDRRDGSNSDAGPRRDSSRSRCGVIQTSIARAEDRSLDGGIDQLDFERSFAGWGVASSRDAGRDGTVGGAETKLLIADSNPDSPSSG